MAERHLRRAYRIPVTLICVSVLIVQAGIVNKYLIDYYSYWWLFWIVGDTVAIGAILVALIRSCMYHSSVPISERRPSGTAGELPLGYISWCIYSVLLATRLAVIFRHIAWTLTESMVFGPNMLKTGLSLSSIVFFCLLLVLADASPDSFRDAYINTVIWRISMDILDTVAVLEVLFLEQSHVFLTFSLHNGIIAIACVNLIIPTLPLVILSKTGHGKTRLTKGIETAQITVYLLAVNIPIMLVRLVLWHVHDQNISVFLIKNVLSIGWATKNIYDHFVDISSPDDVDGNEEAHEMSRMAENNNNPHC